MKTLVNKSPIPAKIDKEVIARSKKCQKKQGYVFYNDYIEQLIINDLKKWGC